MKKHDIAIETTLVRGQEVISVGFLKRGYERRGVFAPEIIMPYIGQRPMQWDGVRVHMNDSRLRLFSREQSCVRCRIKGLFFALERSVRFDKSTQTFQQCPDHQPWHFNFYGLRDGSNILMTQDHILPRSKGGSNADDNLQTMCTTCNAKKGDRLVHQPLSPTDLARIAHSES